MKHASTSGSREAEIQVLEDGNAAKNRRQGHGTLRLDA